MGAVIEEDILKSFQLLFEVLLSLRLLLSLPLSEFLVDEGVVLTSQVWTCAVRHNLPLKALQAG